MSAQEYFIPQENAEALRNGVIDYGQPGTRFTTPSADARRSEGTIGFRYEEWRASMEGPGNQMTLRDIDEGLYIANIQMRRNAEILKQIRWLLALVVIAVVVAGR